MLQNTFYSIGIIFMTLYTLLLIAIVVLLFYIKKKITEVIKHVEDKLDAVKTLASHPRETAAVVGEAVADTALTEVAKFAKLKKRRKNK